MDLESLEGFNEAVSKVTANLKMMEEVIENDENFNSFPNNIPLTVAYLSKRAMTKYSKINFNVGLILPRGSSAASSQSDVVPNSQPTNLPDIQTVSGTNFLSPKT